MDEIKKANSLTQVDPNAGGKVFTGLKASTTNTKNTTLNQAKDGLKRGTGSKRELQKIVPFEVDINTSLDLKRPFIPQRKKTMFKSQMSNFENRHSKLKNPNKLINENDYFGAQLGLFLSTLEERASLAAIPTQRTVKIDKIGHTKAEKRMVDDMAKINELKVKQNQANIKQASNIEPGTEMTARENVIGLTQGATNKSAEGRYQGSQNRARYLDMKEKEMEQQNG